MRNFIRAVMILTRYVLAPSRSHSPLHHAHVDRIDRRTIWATVQPSLDGNFVASMTVQDRMIGIPGDDVRPSSDTGNSRGTCEKQAMSRLPADCDFSRAGGMRGGMRVARVMSR